VAGERPEARETRPEGCLRGGHGVCKCGHGLGKLRLPDTVEAGVTESGFEKLPITLRHAEAAAGLPPYHHDPFDRMLVAQARDEDLVLVTHDRRLEHYDVPILWT